MWRKLDRYVKIDFFTKKTSILTFYYKKRNDDCAHAISIMKCMLDILDNCFVAKNTTFTYRPIARRIVMIEL